MEQSPPKDGEKPIEIRRSMRPRRQPNFGECFISYLVEEDPTTFEVAMSSRDSSLKRRDSVMANRT